jgi:pyruvate formate lyase activating enzyme
MAMDIKGQIKRYGQITSINIYAAKILRSIELIRNSGIEHEFRTTVIRSQIEIQDLLSVVRLLEKSSLYVLQSFIPTKTLNETFHSESSYSPLEFSAICEKIKKEVTRVIIR